MRVAAGFRRAGKFGAGWTGRWTGSWTGGWTGGSRGGLTVSPRGPGIESSMLGLYLSQARGLVGRADVGC